LAGSPISRILIGFTDDISSPNGVGALFARLERGGGIRRCLLGWKTGGRI